MTREAFTVRTADGHEYLIIRDLGEHDAIDSGDRREGLADRGPLTTYEGNHQVTDLGDGWYEIVPTGVRAQRVEGGQRRD